MSSIKSSLKELGFSSNEVKVYLSLTKLGEARASDIAKKAELSRTTTISILERLVEENLITTHKYRGIIYYWIESPRIIKEVYENKVKVADGLCQFLSDLYRSEAKFPYAEVYDTRNAIRAFTEKLLLSTEKGAVIHTIDSPHMGNYQKILSEDFNLLLVELKSKRSITTKTLVPHGSFDLIESYKVESQPIIIREMPEGISFSASVWFMGDKLVFFSSKPPFVVSIQHELIVGGMKSIFDYLWQISVPKYGLNK